MNLDDQFFKNISSSETEVVAPPAWESFSSEVKRQNFKMPGVWHWNYFSVGMLALLIGGGIYAYFNRDAVSVKDELSQQPTVQQTEPLHTEQAAPSANEEETAVSDAFEASPAPVEDTELEQEKPITGKIIKHEQLHEPAVTQAEKKEEQVPVETRIENPAAVSPEQVNLDDKLENDVVLENAVAEDAVAEPKKSGKKSIVFAADTVFEYDTLTVKKKNRRR